MKKVLLLAFLMVFSLQAHAAYWKHVDLGPEDTVEFIDLDSIRFEKELVYYWKKSMITDDADPYRKQYGEKVDSVKTFALEDCRNAIFKPLYSNVLDAEGNVIDFIHHKKHASPVGAWSKHLEWHHYVCSKNPNHR